MRIAFYAPLKPPTHGTPSGDRRVARLLMEALQSAGHRVELVSDFRSFDGKGDLERQLALRNEGATIVRSLVQRWREGETADTCPHLWFTYHLYYKAPDWLGPEVSVALGIPYVVAEASHAPKRAVGPWAVGHAAVERAIRAASLLLCPTRDDAAGLQLVASAHTPVLRLPPFLDPTPYRAAASARSAHRASLSAAHQLDATIAWIVVVAMMREGDKLASYRMLAAALTHLGDLPWQLVVAGDGPARAEIVPMLESAAPGRTRFLGECGAHAMPAVYAAGDLCIWPAVNEAYGMAMLEAQASGLPVVSCAVRGVPDVVCDGVTGLLAAPGDVQALAGCARLLLLDPPRRLRMGQAAARFVHRERSTGQAAATLRHMLADLPKIASAGPAAGADQP